MAVAAAAAAAVVCHSKEVLTFFCALDDHFRFSLYALLHFLLFKKRGAGMRDVWPKVRFFPFSFFFIWEDGVGGSSELSQSFLVFFSLVP